MYSPPLELPLVAKRGAGLAAIIDKIDTKKRCKDCQKKRKSLLGYKYSSSCEQTLSMPSHDKPKC